MGQAGSCLWSTAVGTVPWTVLAWVAKGHCDLVWSLLSVQVGVVSVAALPVVMDCGQCVCVYLCVSVYVSVCVYVSHVCIYVGVGGSGFFLIFFSCFSLLFFILCEALCATQCMKSAI